MPAAPAQEYFRRIIQRLASDYGAPDFEPHLTLGVGVDNLHEMNAVLAALTSSALELYPAGLAFTAKFTKTLFVRFQSTPALRRLRDSLGFAAEEEFDPHVSLLYHRLPEEEQARLASTMHLPFDGVSFDSVVVTRCRLPVASAADVASWETVARRRLDQ